MTGYRTGPVQPGDTIVSAGRPHVVSEVGRRRNGLGWPIAEAADGWAITLDADGVLRIPSPDSSWCVLVTAAP